MGHTGIRFRWVLLAAALYAGLLLWSWEVDAALRKATGGFGALHLEGFGHEKAMGLLGLMGGDGRAFYLRRAYPVFALCAVAGAAAVLLLTAWACRRLTGHVRALVMAVPLLSGGMNVVRHGCIIATLLLYPGENRVLGFVGETANLLVPILLVASVLAAAIAAVAGGVKSSKGIHTARPRRGGYHRR